MELCCFWGQAIGINSVVITFGNSIAFYRIFRQ